MADRVWQPTDNGISAEDIMQARAAILAALQNDLDTPQALAILSGLEGAIDNGGISISSQDALHDLLDWLAAAFGLQLNSAEISSDQKQLITERETARAAQDWARSDELRDELAGQGVIVRDTASGTVWSWQ
jgi:cysteinyl-tRNA synthetase